MAAQWNAKFGQWLGVEFYMGKKAYIIPSKKQIRPQIVPNQFDAPFIIYQKMN
jgi:hypothetical protein